LIKSNLSLEFEGLIVQFDRDKLFVRFANIVLTQLTD